MLKTNFMAITEFDTLTCPRAVENNFENCVIDIDSRLLFCEDSSLDCTMVSESCPAFTIN